MDHVKQNGRIYIHLSGESSKILLQRRGVIKQNDIGKDNALKTRQCPNCFEPNRPDSQFCIRCRIVLSLESYNEVLKRQKEKELEIKQLREQQTNEIKNLRKDVENRLQQIMLKVNVGNLRMRE